MEYHYTFVHDERSCMASSMGWHKPINVLHRSKDYSYKISGCNHKSVVDTKKPEIV